MQNVNNALVTNEYAHDIHSMLYTVCTMPFTSIEIRKEKKSKAKRKYILSFTVPCMIYKCKKN